MRKLLRIEKVKWLLYVQMKLMNTWVKSQVFVQMLLTLVFSDKPYCVSLVFICLFEVLVFETWNSEFLQFTFILILWTQGLFLLLCAVFPAYFAMVLYLSWVKKGILFFIWKELIFSGDEEYYGAAVTIEDVEEIIKGQVS